MKDPVVQAGNPVLRAHAKPIGRKDIGTPALRKLLRHMSRVLAKEEYGVAIAAPQVGSSLRIFVVAGRVFDEPEHETIDGEATTQRHPDMIFINPEITKLSRKKHEMSEGCLSVRGKYGTVVRHEKATVRAWDESGKPFTYNGSELLAHIFQHEVDHLDGILYTDKAVKLERDEKREELREKHPA